MEIHTQGCTSKLYNDVINSNTLRYSVATQWHMPKEDRMLLNKQEVTTVKLTNFTQSIETIQTRQDKERQKKIKENEDYIEYIKKHDKKAYERYLSYSTYLKH